jgi:hypothetical protein
VSRRSAGARIGAVLRQVWAAIWIFAIPKELWGLLRLWPTVFLAVCSYLWQPSARGERLIVLAVLWDLAVQFWLMTSTLKRPRDDLFSTVFRLRDCTYTPIGWDRVIKHEDSAHVDQLSLVSLLGRQGLASFSHARHARFFLVGMGESGMIPGGLGVFNVPFMEAVVLLRDDPRDAGVEERFCLYHELGHTLGDEFVTQSAIHKGVKHPFSSLVLAGVSMHVTIASTMVLASSLVGLWLMHLVFDRRRRKQRAIAEMKADELAITFLGEDEKRYVLRNVAEVLPPDYELSPLEHLARIESARIFIETGVPLARRDPAAAQLPFFGETQLLALNLCAWMVLLAGFIGAPSARLTHGFQWLIAAAIVLGALRYSIYYAKSLVLSLILMERITWQDGRFRLRTGASRAPAPLT